MRRNSRIFVFLLALFNVIIDATEDGSTLYYIYYYTFDSLDFPGSNTWVDLTGDNDVNPCVGWTHVRCDDNNRIVSLDLSDLNISSPQLDRFFLLMPELQTLILRGNNFKGNLPLGFSILNKLTYLDLSGNSFTGTIPVDFDKMTNLTYLNLANNSFSGTVSTTLRKRFCYKFFEGNPSLTPTNQDNFTSCELATFVNSPPPPADTSSSRLGLILGLAVGGSLLVIFVLLLLFYFCCLKRLFAEKPRKLTPEELMEIEAGLDQLNLVHIRRFTMDELTVITNDWAEVIGSGGTAIVYKGSIESNGVIKPVAVKRLKTSNASKATLLQFCTEIDIISRAVHRNVTRLEGFCVTGEERVLLFPYFHFGSVQDHLRGQKFHHNKPISLESRKSIAIGAARGLTYLHDECSVKIIHRDIKAANVLLDTELEAIVTDFGLAQLMDVKETEGAPASKIAGTFGHIAPEYLTSGRLTDKIDVYAYGVFLLELLTGLHAGNFHELCGDDRTIRDWLLSVMASGTLSSYLDIELRAKFLPLDEDGNPILDDVVPMCHVAALCLSSEPEGRPPMSDVVRLLQGEGLADARSKISEDVPESVVSWNVGYGQFNSLSQSLMSFMTEDESTSNMDITSRIDIEDRLR